MKIRTILLMVLSFSTLHLYSQNYPFPTDNATWINVGSSYTLDQWNMPVWQTNWIDRYCANGIDTVINATTYQKIDLCTASSSFYHGAIRFNAGRVFFIPKDSLNEHLLYDFTVNIGDTIDVIQNTCDGWGSTCASTPIYGIMSVSIIDIDTIVVNGTQRRRINQSAGSNQWIEGIGSTAGLFMYFEENVSNYSYGLRCASENDTTIYDYSPLTIGTYGSCDLSLSTTEIEGNSNLKIYPNPVMDNSISIEGINVNQVVDVRIYNSFGEKVLHVFNVTSDSKTIDVMRLNPGVYITHIVTDGSSSVQRLIISN